MDDQEAQLRELMLLDAKVFRVRNQIAEKTDPQSKEKARNRAKAAKVKPADNPTEEPPKCTDT